MKKLYPVIHYADVAQSLRNADLVFKHGCEGLFLIDMTGNHAKNFDKALNALIESWPNKKIGTNRCLSNVSEGLELDATQGVHMTWEDNPGIHTDNRYRSQGTIDSINEMLDDHRFDNDFKYFGSVAFKTQMHDMNPAQAALEAISYGWIPTTSGSDTGVAPTVDKIRKIKEAIGEHSLAVASGIDPENIDQFLPFIDYYLVATGISKTFYDFDEAKLAELSEKIHS